MWKLVSGVVVAILTLWIVPQLTRQIQDRAAERDLKDSIAQEIVKSDTDLTGVAIFRVFALVQRMDVDAITFNKDGSIRHPPSPKLPPKSFTAAYVTWLKRTNKIATTLALEFPENDELSDVYEKVQFVTAALYFVSQRPRKPTYVPTLQYDVRELNSTLKGHGWEETGISLTDEDVDVLAKGQGRRGNIVSFYTTYLKVNGQTNTVLDALIENMDAAQAEGLSTTSCDLLRTAITLGPGHCPWPSG
jgi:hypothetical protein